MEVKVALLTVILCVFAAAKRPPKHSTVRVAAYEQNVHSYRNANGRQEALIAIRENLADMDEKAAIASRQGAKVIVFAEYGVTGNMGSQYKRRRSVFAYMEQIPDMSESRPYCVRCGSERPRTVIQVATGCMARTYKMYVVMNLIEKETCDSATDSGCPSDGHYQFNSNIVFDPKGCMVAKYRKRYMWAEENERLNPSPEPVYSYFDTEYGRFGTVTCMDAIYGEPAYVLGTEYNIDHLLYPTYWGHQSSLDWQLAYSTATNVNFIGANIHALSEDTYGSSILSGSRVVNYTANQDTRRGTLIIGDIPIRGPPPLRYAITKAKRKPPISTNTETVELFGDPFNAVVLEGLTGGASVCHNGLCCSVEYTRNSTEDLYILGAFNGLHTLYFDMYTEVCTVYKCRDGNLQTCGPRELASTTVFSHLELTGNFTVESVFPSMLPSFNRYDLLDWKFQATGSSFRNTIISESRWPMVAVTMTGRVFSQD